ncbi:MAG: CDP-alcohol phosphatidyltransferase family protein [Labilithrix sp.]|nr:CDP-alcohol phosphatidyltransferase family protein [Labilithrix sp.]
MTEAGLVYTVRDRSILLPHYKRLFVEPVIRFLPRRLDPNAITHAGHLVNLAGVVVLLAFGQTGAHGAWPFVVTALCLQLYNWCDNADGAHARRTGRCSAMGELLDHGLDMLNTTYIAYIAAIAIGAPPLWWTALALVVPAACAVTYWEQAETGLFSLGLLNQIESVTMLTMVLAVTAIFGFSAWDAVRVGPITARVAIMGFVCATASFGIVHNVWRVARVKGASTIVRVAPIVLFEIGVLVAAASGAMSTVAAVTIGTAGNVFFGLRSLAMRTAGERPRVERGVVIGAALVWGLVAWRLTDHAVGSSSDVAGSVIATLFFGVLAVANARDARREVVRLDREAAARAVK